MHADRSRRCTGFTVIDLMAVGVVLVILVVLVLVDAAKRTGHRPTRAIAREMMANNTQLRGIHQGMVTWAQSNKTRWQRRLLPRPRRQGRWSSPTARSPATPATGRCREWRLWMMLEGNYFTPEYIINPRRPRRHRTGRNRSRHRRVTRPPITPNNFSYALLAITATTSSANPDGRSVASGKKPSTPPPSCSATGPSAPAPPTSAASGPTAGSGDWRGDVVRNDNSTSFETDHTCSRNTKYGGEPANLTDDLFEDDPAAADAFLVHDDATTGYGAK